MKGKQWTCCELHLLKLGGNYYGHFLVIASHCLWEKYLVRIYMSQDGGIWRYMALS